jgi:hypothetical protein
MLQSDSALLWHYTSGDRWQQIRSSGVIRVATALVDPAERPAAWFSSEPEWEETATKMALRRDGSVIQLSRDQMAALCGGLVRIGVDPASAPHDWHDFRRLSGVSTGMVEHMETWARERGADPAHWFCRFSPVPAAEWRKVEAWAQAGWQPMVDWRPDAAGVASV